MVLEERIEIIKLFISVLVGFASVSGLNFISDDPLTMLLISVSAVVTTYYILGFAESILVKNRND